MWNGIIGAQIKEERFRELFAEFGNLTDCTLKYTKDGKFRKFGFIGFSTEDEAKAALGHYNKSFIDTSRISVEQCKSFGDTTKDKAWSKYAKSKSKDVAKKEDVKQTEDGKKAKKGQNSVLEDLEKDSGFKEFLSVHQNRNKTATWANDTLAVEKVKSRSQEDYLNFDSESEQGSSDEDGGKDAEEKLALQSEISDMDYLRSKVIKDPSTVLSGDEGEKDSEQEKIATKSKIESSEKSKPLKKQKQPVQTTPTTPYTIKLRGAPFNVTEQNVREFLLPLKPAAIRIVRNVNGNKTGYIFVDLKSEADVHKALKKNKDYMGGRYIEVFHVEQAKEEHVSGKSQNRPWEQHQKNSELQEDLADSGRLFVRNLPYSCTEADLEALFSKYGPLSEIHFPIDKLTKKPKGFAFVTFLITEHAVKAYAEVDGHIFQGRMLHVLPSTVKKEDEGEVGADNSGYKKQKALKDKANSSSSHNWNTLFMGTSSVAEVIAQKYNTSKSQVLDHEGKGSVAVRVALGETQIVQDVRRFLLENGVCLDSFSQAASPRSKTVILVKNLPAGTQVTELQEVFGHFGDLGRVLLPEGGITAIVEFLEPTEAKQAFRKLAYTKFQHVPLYLEWAPMDVFSGPPAEKTAEPVKDGRIDEQSKESAEEEPEEKMESEESEDEETLPGCTLFIKNLNFSTNEETLKEVFSKLGAVKTCSISKKTDKQGALLSMGFGFVEYRKQEHAQKALRQLQHITVDDHQLELKLSERVLRPTVATDRKKQVNKKQKSSKILVRNVPFQATVKEIRELFSTFGELKTVRLPKKMAGTGAHRGFGFVDFVTKQDAKRAFSALCHSTHLYGRRLVLEWADTEESVETLRRKTAEQYHGLPKKKKSSALMEDFMGSLEPDDVDE
ncbi:probable RNA-binding protein 19 isoform X2 [Hyla sarda]|uniref:probable RNA-binding protein 19 isoform X2 n=1 Tax=Hyla sarda TaxID=327740 RepID=UPI0024C3FFD6|nr:probable RNA-binding protein 19 isoform X2 [Hyla sarda]